MRALIAASFVGVLLALMLPAIADPHGYPTPTPDGRIRIHRTGTCPTGYVGRGDFCEALHNDTPLAMPMVGGRVCPTGFFRSGDACKSFR